MRWLLVCLGCALSFSNVACDRDTADDGASRDDARSRSKKQKSNALVEEREDGSVAWRIASDGSVEVTVTDASGSELKPPDVGGTLTVNDADVELESGLLGGLSAKIGALESDLTEVRYRLAVKGKTWSGALHVPPGGTDALVAEPQVTVPEGTRGPHGGLVDVVGAQRVELLVDDATGEMRVYFLDENLEEMPVGDAELTIAVAEEGSP